jgi:hypothetical protein
MFINHKVLWLVPYTGAMSLFPEPSPPSEKPDHRLEQTASEGPLDGPSYAYRGATIDCQKGGHVCGVRMPDHHAAGGSLARSAAAAEIHAARAGIANKGITFKSNSREA